jgi:hypothetical protein
LQQRAGTSFYAMSYPPKSPLEDETELCKLCSVKMQILPTM